MGASDGSRLFSNLELPPNSFYVWSATNGQLIINRVVVG